METVESYLRLHSISILVRGLEKRRLDVLEIIANNRTIVDLKDCLKASEAEIKDLKRKVVKFKFFSGKSQNYSISFSFDEITNQESYLILK